MKDIVVNKTNEQCTVNNDVIQLLSFESKDTTRNYILYKTLEYELDRRTSGWVYFLIKNNYEFPLVITEECANQILDDPLKGETLIFNCWLDRYR